MVGGAGGAGGARVAPGEALPEPLPELPLPQNNLDLLVFSLDKNNSVEV
jgi:hypothetical protein